MSNTEQDERQSLQVVEEQLHVSKQVVEEGKVRISKKVNEEETDVNIDLLHEKVRVEKVTINQYVDEAPTVRYEGNSTIIPVVKEVLFVEKRLMLVEEIHIIKETAQTKEAFTVPLRKEEVVVERFSGHEPAI